MAEKAKNKVGCSSSSSSFTVDLFGPSNNNSSSTNTSATLFSSIFGPPNTVPNRGGASAADPNRACGIYNKMEPKDYMRDKGIVMKKDRDSTNNYYDQNGTAPCYFNSSIYYGGQEVYSPPTNHNTPTLKKDGGETTDTNYDDDSNCASRGNWWQGSLYY